MSARMLFAYCICAVLAGCGTVEVRTEYKTVPVPIPVPCAVAVPVEPVYPQAKPDDDIYTAAQKAKAREELKNGYILELKAATVGCGSPK